MFWRKLILKCNDKIKNFCQGIINYFYLLFFFKTINKKEKQDYEKYLPNYKDIVLLYEKNEISLDDFLFLSNKKHKCICFD